MGTIFLVLTITMVICVILANNKTLQTKANESVISAQDQYKDCMEYNEKEKELVVNKPCTYFRRCLFTQPYVGRNYGYEKEKYIYTSATVGGITTGGVHKTGGNYVEKHKTTKVQLIYYYYKYGQAQPDKNIVRKIRLSSDDLIKKAQESPISKFLKNDCIIVEKEIDNKRLNSALLTAAQVGNMNMAGNFNECAKTETMPTKEKCDAIIEWLSTCD